MMYMFHAIDGDHDGDTSNHELHWNPILCDCVLKDALPICEPWCWNIYQHLPPKSMQFCRCAYTSTMVRMWDMFWDLQNAEKSATWTTCNGDSNTGLLPFHPKYVWELSWPNNEARKPISPPNVAQVYHRVLITRWRNPATPALFITFWWPQMHLVPS